VAISSKTLQAILEYACSPRKRLDGALLSDFFDSKELVIWQREMRLPGGPVKLARLLDKEFKRRRAGRGMVALARLIPTLHQCLMVVEVRPSDSVERFYIGFTSEKFKTHKEPGV